jgi:hypothetical protein
MLFDDQIRRRFGVWITRAAGVKPNPTKHLVTGTRRVILAGTKPSRFDTADVRGQRMSALGHERTFAVQKGMSAFPPKADMCGAKRDFGFSRNL